MDLRVLRQIAALEQTGSFSKAAETLGVTQPALSKSISNFEDELGVRIVERTPQGSELTEIGKLIADRARAILQETKQLYRDAELAADGGAGVLRLGLTNTLKGVFLERFVEKVRERHPDLAIEVIVDVRAGLLSRLRDRRLDMIACLLSPLLQRERLEIAPLSEGEVAAFAHPDHPLAKLETVTLEDLARYRVLNSIRNDFDPFRGGEAGEPDNLRFYATNDYDALLFLATSGLAPIVCTTRYIRHAPGGALLKRLPIDMGRRVTYVAATTPAAASIPIIRRALGYAQDAAREL